MYPAYTCSLYGLLLILCVHICQGVEEDISDGSHSPRDSDHYTDGDHNTQYDHEAILGSKKLEEEFDDLPPEEAKKRLRLILKKMDSDGDSFLTEEELTNWVIHAFKMLDDEEAIDGLKEQDEDKDNRVSWAEFVKRQNGYSLKDIEDLKIDPSAEETKNVLQLLEEDEARFNAADLNKDKILDKEEYLAFYHPYDYEHMHNIELDKTMKDTDLDKDGFISLKEFIGESNNDREWELVEEERFKDYDKNEDGKLDREELKPWVLSDSRDVAMEEAQHLIDEADADRDGRLSEEEVIDKFDLFVGSSATDYGRHLHIIKDEL